MRLLHTADWHLGKYLEGWSRMEEQEAFIEELISIADKNKVDMILICGDIFDSTNPSAEAEKLFFRAINHLSRNGERIICLISGNHDSSSRLIAPSPLTARQGIFIMDGTIEADEHLIKEGRVIKWGTGYIEFDIKGERVVLLALPYPSEARLKQIFSLGGDERERQQSYSRKVGELFTGLEQYYRDNTINIAMSHLFVAGGQTSRSERPIQVGGGLTVHIEDLPSRSQYTALGHLHRYQIASSAHKAYYSGSPLQYSLSERNHKKCLNLVELHPGEEARIEQLELTNYKPLEVWEADGYIEALKLVEENKKRQVWAYLQINVEKTLLQSEIKEIKELKPDILSINPLTPETRDELDYLQTREEELDIMELFREYYLQVKEVEPTDEVIKMFAGIVNGEEVEDEAAASKNIRSK